MLYQREIDRGQAVDVSYTGWIDGEYYRRTTDRSVPLGGPGRVVWSKVQADHPMILRSIHHVAAGRTYLADLLARVPAVDWIPCSPPSESDF